jgi:spore coat protein CotH
MKINTLLKVVSTSLLILLALISIISLVGCVSPSTSSTDESTAPFYTDRVVTVTFVMTEEDWTYLQTNAREESYVQADMWYDGELISDIAVRPKGNSSLSSTISSGSIKFGLKVDLNFFNAERTLDGVKKLNFNNGWSDPTFLREILSYELFEEMGLPTPRASFVDVYVNDTHLGLYTMVEQVDTAFLARYFTDTNGNLYKPEMPAGYLNWTEEDVTTTATGAVDTSNVNLGGGNLDDILTALGQDTTTDEETITMPGIQGGFNFGNIPSDNTTPRVRPNMGNLPMAGNVSGNFTRRETMQGGQGFAMGGNIGGGFGASGNYLEQMGLKTNENKPEYTALYRLLDVLNNEPDDTFAAAIENVLDVDQVLRYLAVSAVLVHLDNYTGMGHNYYLYEVDGKFTIIPWDLNMSFGGFNSSLGTDGIINFLIDEPTAGAVADRPLVARLLAVPEYLETYHQYINEMINGCFSEELMNSRIDELADLIRPYVAADALKFYTINAFESYLDEGTDSLSGGRMGSMGANIGLKAFVAARIESIKKQLAGELASANNGQGNGGGSFGGGDRILNGINPGQQPGE